MQEEGSIHPRVRANRRGILFISQITTVDFARQADVSLWG
jgi:hypothetical protein